MNVIFRPPLVSGATEREQIEQLRRYLFQLAEQLNVMAETQDKHETTIKTIQTDLKEIKGG